MTEGPPLLMFDHDCAHLPNLDDTQIGWWDECHIEQQGGRVGNKMIQYSFKRDEQGNLCPNGTYNKELLTRTSYKYPEQGRFSFGVAKVRKVGANEDEGVKMEHIDYTNRNICTIDVFAKHMGEECSRVRKLTGEVNSIWIECGRPKDELWANNAISQIKGAGRK